MDTHIHFAVPLWLIVFGVDMLKRWLDNDARALAQAFMHIKLNSKSVGHGERVAVLLTFCLHIQRSARHRAPSNIMLPVLALACIEKPQD